MGEDRGGMWVEVPEGAVGQAVVEGAGHGSGVGVSGVYEGRVQVTRHGSHRAPGE